MATKSRYKSELEIYFIQDDWVTILKGRVTFYIKKKNDIIIKFKSFQAMRHKERKSNQINSTYLTLTPNLTKNYLPEII